MTNYQQILFDWAAQQHALTGAVLLGLGLLSGFLGFRMVRFLLVVSTGGILAVVTGMVALKYDLPVLLPAVATGLGGAFLGLLAARAAVTVNAALTIALMAAYIATQVGIQGNALWVILALFAAGGGTLGLISHRTMLLVITTLQGSVLMIIGVVGVASELAPSIGGTFCQWARTKSLIVPMLLTMVTTMAYSVQVSKRQGDICTGR